MIDQSVVTIGCFDGIHLGHREIIDYTVNNSNLKDAYLFTFKTNPGLFFSEKKFNFSISTLEQNNNLLKENFFDLIKILEVDFSEEFSKISAEDFIRDIIIKNLKASLIVVGKDFKFGHKCSGDISFLKSLQKKYEFQIKVIEDVCNNNGVRYSSTNIRNLIRSAKMFEAKEHLGRYWQVEGEVLHGKKIGLKYSTANISIGSYVWPKFGVYVVGVILEDKRIFPGIANFGICPTFSNNKNEDLLPENVSLEVHILNNFNEDIYGQKIKVDFIDFIREEMKFDSKFLLESKIDEDCKIASSIFEKLS